MVKIYASVWTNKSSNGFGPNRNKYVTGHGLITVQQNHYTKDQDLTLQINFNFFTVMSAALICAEVSFGRWLTD